VHCLRRSGSTADVDLERSRANRLAAPRLAAIEATRRTPSLSSPRAPRSTRASPKRPTLRTEDHPLRSSAALRLAPRLARLNHFSFGSNDAHFFPRHRLPQSPRTPRLRDRGREERVDEAPDLEHSPMPRRTSAVDAGSISRSGSALSIGFSSNRVIGRSPPDTRIDSTRPRKPAAATAHGAQPAPRVARCPRTRWIRRRPTALSQRGGAARAPRPSTRRGRAFRPRTHSSAAPASAT